MDYEEDFDEGSFVDEGNAYERAGQSGVTALLTKEQHKNATIEDRFKSAVNTAFLDLKGENLIRISDADLRILIEKIDQITVGVKYKNPTCYILGYVATSGGTKMNKSGMDTVLKIVPKLDKKLGIEPPDVIRYARYWRQFL